MKRVFVTATLVAWAMIGAAPALADWNPGDAYKMHYPQLPDPFGWDVAFTQGRTLADDWLCTASGPVSDLHFWFSAAGDQQFDPMQIVGIHASIHSDVPPNGLGYSTPGDLLWERDFQFGQYTIRRYAEGDQGWFDPVLGTVLPHDHRQVWQANIEGIVDPFPQEQGKIYWLDLSVIALDVLLGWKTSASPHFQDDAVARLDIWRELRDPITSQSLDLAFVITPEPASLLMAAFSGVALAATFMLRKRR